jgi:hypothetical protein
MESENGSKNLFSLSADAGRGSDGVMSKKKLPGICFESMPLLVQEPIRC